MAESKSPDLTGTVIDDRYRLTRFVEAQTFGDVYEAEQLRLDRAVTIKILGAAPHPEAIERFMREAKVLSKLDHPGIVYVLDFGAYQGRPYLVRDFVKGKTLEKELAERKRFTPEAALPILIHLAEALEHVHAAGVIHRNLTPDNVVLGDDMRARIANVGLARLSGPSAEEGGLTSPGMVIGSSPYMAPEQARGAAADERSDLYALGAIAYHMLSGHKLFEAPSLADILIAQASRDPIPLAERAKLPKEAKSLCEIVDKLVARDPEKRFPTASRALLALRAAVYDLSLPDATSDAHSLSSFPKVTMTVGPPPIPRATSSPKGGEAEQAWESISAFLPPPAPPPFEEPSLSQDVPGFFEPRSKPALDAAASSGRIEITGTMRLAHGDPLERTFFRSFVAALPTLASIMLVVGLLLGFWIYVIGLPDPAGEARNAVRLGRGSSVIMQLEALTKKGDADPRLNTALGYAHIHAGHTIKALAPYAEAAKRSPDAFTEPDVAALVALLALPTDDSLEAERIVRLVAERAKPWLRLGFSTVNNERYLRCRSGDVLQSLGEANIDPVPVCAESLAAKNCAQRALLIRRLSELRDKRAVPALKQLASRRTVKECGAEEAAAAADLIASKDAPQRSSPKKK